jgi:uncharacterized repeat protein (TIGR04138 family)
MADRGQATQARKAKTVAEVATELGVYPVEAFDFLHRGLAFTTDRIHGKPNGKGGRHVSGAQLCDGLRMFAQQEYGLMARAVLGHWNITSTYDFGRLVFALVDGGLLQKTEQDSPEDFRNVYDFAALDVSYRIQSKL